MSNVTDDFGLLIEKVIAKEGVDPAKKINFFNMALEEGKIGDVEYDAYVNRVNQPPLQNVVDPAAMNRPETAPAPQPPTPSVAGAEYSPHHFQGPMPLPEPTIPFSPMGAAGPMPMPSPPPVTIYKHEEPELEDAENFYAKMGDQRSLAELEDKGIDAVSFKKYKDGLWKYAMQKAQEMQMPAIRMSSATDDEYNQLNVTREQLAGMDISPVAQTIGAAVDDMALWGMVQQAAGLMPKHPIQEHLEREGFIPDATEKIQRNVGDNPWTYAGTSAGGMLGGALIGGLSGGPPGTVAGGILGGGGKALMGLSGAAIRSLEKWAPKAMQRLMRADIDDLTSMQRMGRGLMQGLPAGAAIEAGQLGVGQLGQLARGQEFDPTQLATETGMRTAGLALGELGGVAAADWIMRPLGNWGRELFTKDVALEEALRSFQALDSHAMRKSKAYRDAALEAELGRKGKRKGYPGVKQPGLRPDHVLAEDVPEAILDAIRFKEKDIYAKLNAHNEELLAGLDDVEVDAAPLIAHLESLLAKRTFGPDGLTAKELVERGEEVLDPNKNALPFVDNEFLYKTWKRLNEAVVTPHRVYQARRGAPAELIHEGEVVSKIQPRPMSAKNVVTMVEALDHKLKESAAAAGDSFNPMFEGMQRAVRDVREQLGTEYAQAMEDHSLILASLGNLKHEMGILGRRLRKTGDKKYHGTLVEAVSNRVMEPIRGGDMPSPMKPYGKGKDQEFSKLRAENPELEQKLQNLQESLAIREKGRALKKAGFGFWHTMLGKIPAGADAVFYGMQHLGKSPLLPILGMQQFGPYTKMKRPIPAPGQIGYRGPGTAAEQNIKDMASVPDEEKDAQMKVMKIIQESR